MNTEQIAPVLVLSTGRCGSTMLSDVLNLHPDVLSLSEVFSLLGPLALFRKRLGGKAMWGMCSRQNPALRVLLSADTIVSEILYPFDDPRVRYTTRNVPPILCTMLPHLTPDYENLYDDLKSVVRDRPRAPLAEQYRHLFDWLRHHFDRRVWVERSGGSLLVRVEIKTALSGGAHRSRLPRRTGHGLVDEPASGFPDHGCDAGQVAASGPEAAGKYGRGRARWASLLAMLFLRLVNPARMIRREFDLTAYGSLWSQMILRGQKLLDALPPDRGFVPALRRRAAGVPTRS